MNTIRNQRVKNFLKKIKEHFLLRTPVSEMILIVVVVALIVFKYAGDKSSARPVGDYGPSPYEKHINSQNK